MRWWYQQPRWLALRTCMNAVRYAEVTEMLKCLLSGSAAAPRVIGQ